MPLVIVKVSQNKFGEDVLARSGSYPGGNDVVWVTIQRGDDAVPGVAPRGEGTANLAAGKDGQ